MAGASSPSTYLSNRHREVLPTPWPALAKPEASFEADSLAQTMFSPACRSMVRVSTNGSRDSTSHIVSTQSLGCVRTDLHALSQVDIASS